MKVDSVYINKHLAQLEAIKLRAIEINNFLADVEVDEDWCSFTHCDVHIDYLDIETTDETVDLSYVDWDDQNNIWSIPIELFDYDEQKLIQYAHDITKGDKNKYIGERERNLTLLAKELGYRLVKEENNDND